MSEQSKQLRGEHAIKLNVSTELKTRLVELSESLDRPLADVCRTLLWMAVPMMEGMDRAQRRGRDWWSGCRERVLEERVSK